MRRTEKQRAISLRLQGKSYNEIRKMLNIPSKGTLSYWFRGLRLSNKAKEKLSHNINLAHKRGLFAFNRQRTRAIKRENALIRKNAANSILRLSEHDLFLIGIALYWGEGFQSERNKSVGLRFINSNHKMIALFMRFIGEILKIDRNRIKASIRIYPNIDKEAAIRFWSKITRLPKDRFHITHQISKASSLKRPQNSLPNGTLDIRVNDRRLFFKMKGYIDGLAKQVNK